jgi:hypothetical protein
MQRGELLGERNRDGGHVHVDRALGQGIEQPTVQHRAAHRLVVGQHRERHRRDGDIQGCVAGVRAVLQQGFARRRAAVPHMYGVAGLEQIARHRRAHRPQAQKSDVHHVSFVFSCRSGSVVRRLLGVRESRRHARTCRAALVSIASLGLR